ncbi:carboxypeptidase regulatory-like domain-containing protein [Granulicella cerasi]|uniref:Carboxypeptidase regulatory-like domain-containing protein n=1 Tax=Granulicella cerasi TaxID=741063 RepID=A0ABW1Z9P8_9BACT|nr:TonB-dependent receptor [Granulicella cerasi]
MQLLSARFPRLAWRTLVATVVFLCGAVISVAQSGSGSVNGSVVDPSGAVVPGATITIQSPVSGYSRSTTSGSDGSFSLPNLPFNSYIVFGKMSGFSPARAEVAINSGVPRALKLTLNVASDTTTVTVDAPVDLVENDPHFHTDIDRSVIDRMPIESSTSGLSAIITQSSPGVAADSNGLMHGLGDHAENSFSVDGQPITDQQSKVFSNQVPASAIQSLEVIDGAPPAEYGDKTSLVVKATTRSGQGVTTPTGSASLHYGSFGSSSAAFDVAYGGKKWGEFFAVDGQQTGRFLDAPEFAVMHDKGNEANIFNRYDYQFNNNDSVHLNFQYTRSWFQTPNTFANLNVLDMNGNNVGNTDQKSKIGTINFSPSWTHVINNDSVFNMGMYVRRDAYNYYGSSNPLADYVEAQQQEAVNQSRSLLNWGTHADVSYLHGIHNAKLGVSYGQTFLDEHDNLGIVDPTLNDPTSASYDPTLAPYDLTRGGGFYSWNGHTVVKQFAAYAQDSMTLGAWQLNLGIRGDVYNGLTIQRMPEPRAGVSYTVHKTGTVLRASYARTQETPFNENLVLSSTGCADPVIYGIFQSISGCASQGVTPFNPGYRNEFHAGLQQALGKHFVVNAEYIWKYTHNAYDFSVLGTTPITFPIEWHNSKIPGYALSATLTDIKGVSVRFNASSVAARFFNPQIGGVGATPVSTSVGISNGFAPFRIDHDEKFNETTNVQYNMPFRKSLWYSMNWKFDSGLVAGAAPCYNPNGVNTDCDPATAITINGQPGIDLSGLTADQQFQAGLSCNGVAATPTNGFQQCTVAGLKSSLLNLPGINSEDADHNPSRVRSRNLFDMALGDDNIVHFGATGRYKIAGRVTAINVTNKYALYNFLSTFSGTHYVSPRTITGEIALRF